MSEETFLYYINKRELENNQISLERPTILRAYQKCDELRICKKLMYFQYPDLNSYPLHINTSKIDEEEEYSGPTRKVYELYIKEKDLCNKNTLSEHRIKLFTQRRVLTNIFAAPYSHNKFIIMAKRHGNMIFMTMERTESKPKYLKDVMVFSSICERDSPNVHSNAGTTINDCERGSGTNVGYMVFGAAVDNFDIVYTNRASPVLSETTIENVGSTEVLNNCNFVLAKLLNEGKYDWMKTTPALKWWSQGFLSAIDNIFVGLIDTESFIHKPGKLYKVDDIKEAQRKRINVCQAFLHKFLKLVEESTTGAELWDMIYIFNFNGKGKITYSMENREPGSIIFSEEFAEYLKNQ